MKKLIQQYLKDNNIKDVILLEDKDRYYLRAFLIGKEVFLRKEEVNEKSWENMIYRAFQVLHFRFGYRRNIWLERQKFGQ